MNTINFLKKIIIVISILIGISACGKSESSHKAQQHIPLAPAQAPPLAESSSATSDPAHESAAEIKFALTCIENHPKGGSTYLMVSMGKVASLLTSSLNASPDAYSEYILMLEKESTEEYQYGSVGASDEARARGASPYILNRQDLKLTLVGVGGLAGLRWTFSCQMAQDKAAILEAIKTKRNEYKVYKKQKDLEAQQLEEQKKRNTKI